MWTNEELQTLSDLDIDPVKITRENLVALVQHFKRGGGIYAPSKKGEPVRVSSWFARKIRNLTRSGKLDWLLPPDERSVSGAPPIVEEKDAAEQVPHADRLPEGLQDAQMPKDKAPPDGQQRQQEDAVNRPEPGEAPPTSSSPRTPDPVRPRRRLWWILTGVTVAAIPLVAFVLWVWVFRSPPCTLKSFRPPTSAALPGVLGTIEVPRHCSTGLRAGEVIPASGTYGGDLASRELWLLVFAHQNADYYPQSPDACLGSPATAREGRWSAKLYLGEKRSLGERFDVILAVAERDGEASVALKNWLRNGCSNPDKFRGGFGVLPGGLSEIASVTVGTRRE